MIFEDIKDEQIQKLVSRFYVLQAALIRTPLGQVNANQKPEYPRYFKKYQEEFKQTIEELERQGIRTEKVRLSEEPNPRHSMSFLNDLQQQDALKIMLRLEDEVIQPSDKLDNQVTLFISKLPTPWK